MCSKLTMKIPERRQWRRSGVFLVNFEHISHLSLVGLLLNLKRLAGKTIVIILTSIYFNSDQMKDINLIFH